MGRRRKLLRTPQAATNEIRRDQETPEQKAIRNLRSRLNHYKISVYDCQEMLRRQRDCCAICGREISLSVLYQATIDHSHRSGKFRGILCAFCNKGLKYYKHLRRLDSVVQAYLGEEED